MPGVPQKQRALMLAELDTFRLAASGPKKNIKQKARNYRLYIGLSPILVIVTTRICTFLVGDSYKLSFATVAGKGVRSQLYILG